MDAKPALIPVDTISDDTPAATVSITRDHPIEMTAKPAQDTLNMISLTTVPGLTNALLRTQYVQNYVTTLVSTSMVATNPAFVYAIEEAVWSDREFNNLLSNLMTSNMVFSIHQKGSIEARTMVYAEHHSSIFRVHVSLHPFVAPYIAQSVSFLLPDLSMVDAHESDKDNDVVLPSLGGRGSRRA